MKARTGIRFPILIGIVAAAVASTGCSFSKSSAKSSEGLLKSASSPFKSISGSSATEQDRYQTEVRDYTAEFARASKGDMEGFRKKVGGYASKHGISDWENSRDTYVAIGQGLNQASMKGPQYESFRSMLGEGDPQKMGWIDEGYGN